MLRLSALLALLISVSAQADLGSSLSGLDFNGIYDGTTMTQNDYGWKSTVYVQLENGRCTGTLITPTAVLTAAHCAVAKPKFVAFFNGEKLIEPRLVKSYAIHPKNSTNPQGWSEHNDLAVLRLESPVSSKFVPVPLLTDLSLLKGEVVIEGFGRTSPNGNDKGLTQATLAVVGIDSGGYFVQLKDPAGRQSGCVGDSGGPGYVKVNGQYYLAAVSSFIDAEDRNCSSGTHATFSQIVVNYLKWIGEEVRK